MYLDWKPLYRDIGFYYITITYMVQCRPPLPVPMPPPP